MVGRTSKRMRPLAWPAIVIVALAVGVIIGRAMPDGGATLATPPGATRTDAPEVPALPTSATATAGRPETAATQVPSVAPGEPPAPSDAPAGAGDERGETPVGAWTDVTPAGVAFTGGTCDSYGSQSVGVDPDRPSDLYAQINCLGIWRSTDYGRTWSGPINTGRDGAAAGDCAGGIAIVASPDDGPPTLYQACIRGEGTGFWRSLDGGENWTRFPVQPSPHRQDYYPPVVDPHDPSHIMMTGHEFNMIVESFDGGEHWSEVPMDPRMEQGGGTAHTFMVDTGDPATTAKTLLYLPQSTGGNIGTWRTDDGGANWTRVERLERGHGNYQPFQPDASGLLYLAGEFGSDGHGVYRSTDFGRTWEHVGEDVREAIVFGTPSRVYTGFGWACGDCEVDAVFQTAEQPGDNDWEAMDQPSDMAIGPAQVAVTLDGNNHVLISANWRDGIWRYVEP